MMDDHNDEQDETAVEMKFCSECNNMLYPRENKVLRQLEFFCRRCNYKETSADYIVYRNDIKFSQDVILHNIHWEELVKDPTLPRATITCKVCKNQEVVLLQAGFGMSSSGGGGMRLWFICTSCFHRWSNEEEESRRSGR